MIAIEQTKQILTDDKTYQVADLPPQLQNLIRTIDDWRERAINFESELNMANAALIGARNQLQQSIVQIEEERAKDISDSEPVE